MNLAYLTEEELDAKSRVSHLLDGYKETKLTVKPKWIRMIKKWHWSGSDLEFIDLVNQLNLTDKYGTVVTPYRNIWIHINNPLDPVFNHPRLSVEFTAYKKESRFVVRFNPAIPEHRFLIYSIKTNNTSLPGYCVPLSRALWIPEPSPLNHNHNHQGTNLPYGHSSGILPI